MLTCVAHNNTLAMSVTCGICSDAFAMDSTVSVTLCGHLFHETCLTEWFSRSDTCPNCRTVAEYHPIRVYLDFHNREDEENLGRVLHQVNELNSEIHLKDVEIKEKNKEIKKLKDEKQQQLELLFRKYTRRLLKLSRDKREQLASVEKKYQRSIKLLTKEKNDLRKQLSTSEALVKKKHAKIQDLNKKYVAIAAKHLREEEKNKCLREDQDTFRRNFLRVSDENAQLRAKILMLQSAQQWTDLESEANTQILGDEQQRTNFECQHTADFVRHMTELKGKIDNILGSYSGRQPRKRVYSRNTSSAGADRRFKYMRTNCDSSPGNFYRPNFHDTTDESDNDSSDENENTENNNETMNFDSERGAEVNNEAAATAYEMPVSLFHDNNIPEAENNPESGSTNAESGNATETSPIGNGNSGIEITDSECHGSERNENEFQISNKEPEMSEGDISDGHSPWDSDSDFEIHELQCEETGDVYLYW